MTLDANNPPFEPADESLARRPTTPPTEAMGVDAKVVCEQGRWVVYLSVDWWEPSGGGHPVNTRWHRIADYPRRQQAEVAAQWMCRAANRDRKTPPLGI